MFHRFFSSNSAALCPTGSMLESVKTPSGLPTSLPKMEEPRMMAYSPAEDIKAYAAAEPIVPYSNKYFAMCGIGGILSCGITHTLVTPLDLVKCNMQANPQQYKGIIQGFGVLLSKESTISPFRGWAPTAIGYSMQGVCKFGFYEYFKWKYAQVLGEETATKYRALLYCAASASAEFIADVALCPMESVKVRVQTDPKYADCTGLRDGTARLLKEEGMSGFYKSLTPLWARQVPYTIIKFVAFEKVVEFIYGFLPKDKSEYGKTAQLGVTFLAGYIAGIFCAIVSHPADTMVSKLGALKTADGAAVPAGKGVGIIYAEIGFAGLWRGLVARIIMIGTLTGLQWFIYDSFKVFVGLPTTGGVVKKEKDDA